MEKEFVVLFKGFCEMRLFLGFLVFCVFLGVGGMVGVGSEDSNGKIQHVYRFTIK